MPLRPTLTYTNSNLKNLINWIEDNKFIDYERWNHKNRHPRHNLPKTCGGSKSVCPVWIHSTENLLTHLRTSFRINERWYNKYYTHRSIINKRRLVQRTRKRFRPRKAIKWNKKVWIPNRHPCHDLTQTCGGRKSICPDWIWPIDNFPTYLRTSFDINKFWSYKYI